MAEFEGGAAEAEGAGMAEDISASSDVVDDSMAEAKLQSNTAESGEISEKLESIQESKNAAVEKVLDGLKGKLNIEGSMDQTIEDIQSGKSTPDTEKLTSDTKTKTDGINEWVEKEKAANGEKGNSLEESPKTKKTLLEKYGPKAFIILAILSIIGGNVFAPKGIQQCHQMPTCGSGGEVVTINCSSDMCNCTNISKCGSYPACGQSSSNCMYYYFQSMDTKTIIATLPFIAYSTYLAPPPPKSNTFRNIIILVGILIIGLAVVFMIYKLTNKNKV